MGIRAVANTDLSIAPISIETRPRLRPSPSADAIVAAGHLSRLGWSLLPLGLGKDGKGPSLSFAKVRRHPFSLIEAKMQEHGSSMFAVRLEGVVVVDADTDNAETRAYIEKRFGSSPFCTSTSRGFHLYFRKTPGMPVPSPVRRPGIAIDFKSGRNQYVVAPGSTRLDGTVYRSTSQELGSSSELPPFLDLEASGDLPAPKVVRLDGSTSSGRVAVGERNNFLNQKAIEYVETCDSEAELVAELTAYRDHFCEDPGTIFPAEIAKVAGWAWRCRLENRIFKGQNSMVKTPRAAIEVLLPLAGGGAAHNLLSYLSAVWQHQPKQPFAIVPAAIHASGALKMGRNQIYDAIKLLLAHGFLVQVYQSRGVKDPNR